VTTPDKQPNSSDRPHLFLMPSAKRPVGARPVMWVDQGATRYAYLSWSTRTHFQLIDGPTAHRLGPILLAAAQRHGARLIEIGVTLSHVHLLLELSPVCDATALVKGLKSASSRVAPLRWEAGHQLRFVAARRIPHVASFVRLQERAHLTAPHTS
jgi:REP element-mobilizing transposase RayT